MIYETQFHGLRVRSGDIICTTNGSPAILPGEFWRMVGRLVPGEVDHVALYIGPAGRCVESGPRGVITFEMPHRNWNANLCVQKRAMLVDTFIGIAYPLAGLGLTESEECRIRADVATYIMAQVGKPYNLNLLNPETEDAFYCSQLAYKAYQRHGINLNTGQGIPTLPGTERIIFPQEIWSGCQHSVRVTPGDVSD